MLKVSFWSKFIEGAPFLYASSLPFSSFLQIEKLQPYKLIGMNDNGKSEHQIIHHINKNVTWIHHFRFREASDPKEKK